MLWIYVTLIVVTFFGTKAKYFSLDSNNWFLTDNNNQYKIKDARVPGGIYTELHRAKIIKENLFYAKNDVAYRLFSKLNWIWSRKFQVSAETIRSAKKIVLIAEGVDTVSNIHLNDQFIGNTSNMFVQYEFDITKSIHPGVNYLQVRIVSPIRYSISQFEVSKEQYGYIVPPECSPAEYKGECHANFIRKMAVSYGSNWSPAFPSLGIWKPIGIEVINKPILKDFSVSIKLIGNQFAIDIGLKVHKPDTEYSIMSRVLLDGKEITYGLILVEDPSYYQLDRIWIPKKDVQLWWPNGIGRYSEKTGYTAFSPKLYNLTVRLVDIVPAALVFGSITKRIGFRTIEILEKPTGGVPYGLSFQFQVNDALMFVKGTTIVPFSIFPEVVDVPYIRSLLSAVVEGGMNMIRVWGGGIYQPDIFYDLADEMGILIWQDFMFAGSAYPANPAFLETVSQEAAQQVDRLKTHPCLALWAGNDEVELAIASPWWPRINENFERYRVDYISLNNRILYSIVKKADPGRYFLPSSPSDGRESMEEGGLARHPANLRFGDYHYSSSLADPWNHTLFPRARFISKYGYQSHPSLETYAPVVPAYQLTWPLSPDLLHRQHQPNGYNNRRAHVALHLKLPQAGGKDALKKYIYLTNVIQTEAVKLQSEAYLRNRYLDPKTSLGLTWGALYWQLNDVWQAPTCSSIEFGGKWKMLHYSIVKLFRPVHVQAYLEGGHVKVVATNDMVTDANILISVYIYKFSSFDGFKLFEGSLKISRYDAKQVYTNTMENILSQSQCQSVFACVIRIRYRLTTPSMPQPSTESPSTLDGDNHLLLASPKKFVGLARGIIRIAGLTRLSHGPVVGTNRFKIDIRSDSIALWVWLDFKLGSGIKGKFSDNGFFQYESSKTVFFDDPTGKINGPTLIRNLLVTSLTQSMT